MANKRKDLNAENEEVARALSWYGDITFWVDVELGRMTMPLREVLDLKEGSIVELNKTAGEAVDVLVNHRLLATAEIVVIEENFAVRITDIIDDDDLLEKILQGAYRA